MGFVVGNKSKMKEKMKKNINNIDASENADCRVFSKTGLVRSSTAQSERHLILATVQIRRRRYIRQRKYENEEEGMRKMESEEYNDGAYIRPTAQGTR